MKKHIFVGTPCYDDNVTLPYHNSYIQMQDEAHHKQWKLSSVAAKGFTSQARNLHAALALRDKSITHFLTIDADMGWPKGLLSRFIAADKDIVGATYPMRQLSEKPIFIGAIKEGADVTNGFCRAKYVGCGFMLVKREALEKIAAKLPVVIDECYPNIEIRDFFPSGVQHGRTITDDVGFCAHAMAAGCEVWADIVTELTHTGSVTFKRGALGDYVL